jgi:DNA (cytosine-5)-methyltransferase 1
MTLTVGSLFAGIGGMDLGLERAGMTVKWQVEIDDYAARVLAKHWPAVPRYRDVRDVGAHNLESVDLVCGGFPCQPHSLAGRRGANSDDRDLWAEFARIICEIQPRWVLAENVPGLLSSDARRFFGRVLGDLAALGYDAEWSIVSACSMGAPHTRERLFILAHARSRRDRLKRQRVIGQAHSSEKRHVSFWQSQPMPDRVADGVPRRVDRLRGLGNAVVPQVAEYIGRQIMAAADNHPPPKCSQCDERIDSVKWPNGIEVTLHGKQLALCLDCFDGMKQAIIYQDDQ